LPNRPLTLEHLVVAPRGLVVVAPSFGQVLRGGHTYHGAGWRLREAPGHLSTPWGSGTATTPDRRPALVRETLRRCCALRSWLKASPWDGVPVLAAVCSCPVARPPAPPWLMLDGLWLGAADQLPAWFVADEVLSARARAELGRFLAGALPVA
jgi:hypothetical protein